MLFEKGPYRGGDGTPVLILDGGFGTTLEDIFHKDIACPLWSAKPTEEEPQLIIDAHLAFLRAGADIILTSTYQSAYSTFQQSGYSREDAKRLMRKSVQLAQEAKAQYLSEQPHLLPNDIRLVLSLGPFGATLHPAQEFDGFYPPPYGPQGYDPSRPGDNHNAFGKEADEETAIERLVDFHLERLEVFAQDEEVWRLIDGIAFETVPLRREIRAIRRSVGLLTKKLEESGGETKPWWICTVHSAGRFPEEKTTGGERVEVRQIVEAELDEDKGASSPIPPAIGVNCTSMEFIPGILKELSSAVKAITASQGVPKPWLVIYPNGGELYDPTTRTWIRSHIQGDPKNETEIQKSESWESRLREIVQGAREEGWWAGIVVGGCCKTVPKDIELLAKDERWLRR